MDKKVVVILGPTASGKTKLAIKLAKKFNGEVVSADSRQVYKGLDIGTDKVTPSQMQGITHYLLDVASPKQKFTVSRYKKLAEKSLEKILKKGKLPIICGGTGFYIQALIDGILIPEVNPDWKLRKELEKKSTKELFQLLKKLDPRRAKTIEKGNSRRLIRAIEIAKRIGRVPTLKKAPLPYPVLMLGIKREKKELRLLIKKRFFKWLKQGLLQEIKSLKKSRLSWRRIEEFGIHYRVVAKYLQKKITYQEMIERSLKELNNYAKRQVVWFKQDKRIIWVKNYREAEKLVKTFLEKN